MKRPSVDEVMLGITLMLSTRSTCDKLQVGCVLTDAFGRVLSAGYNGTPRGMKECYPDWLCHKRCQATHAESNAIISCHADRSMIYTCYVTHSPCFACAKQLVQTGCQDVVFINRSGEFEEFSEFWTQCNRTFRQISVLNDVTCAK